MAGTGGARRSGRTLGYAVAVGVATLGVGFLAAGLAREHADLQRLYLLGLGYAGVGVAGVIALGTAFGRRGLAIVAAAATVVVLVAVANMALSGPEPAGTDTVPSPEGAPSPEGVPSSEPTPSPKPEPSRDTLPAPGKPPPS